MEQTFDPGPSPPASTEYRQRPTDAAPEWAAAFPAFAAVGLMLLWAAHDGGYDADTWYWGALAILGLLVVLIAGLGTRVFGVSRITKLAFASFAGYVGWSYLSIAWAGSPGDALQGSNRALLFLLVFALFVATPWTPRLAFWLLMTYTVGVGAIAVVILLRIAGGHSSTLFSDGRLVAPTGYFNASAALFTAAALAAVALAARREAPTILREHCLRVAARSFSSLCWLRAGAGSSRFPWSPWPPSCSCTIALGSRSLRCCRSRACSLFCHRCLLSFARVAAEARLPRRSFAPPKPRRAQACWCAQLWLSLAA